MQRVSQAWKDNQNNTLVSESDITISLKMTDPDAYEDASATDNGKVFFADTSYIVGDGDKEIHSYATLETNQWVLDGSREIVPNSNYGEGGYIGNVLCGNDRLYTTNPIVSIGFTKVHTNLLQGITITWSNFLNEYAEEFVVTAYNGEAVVAEKHVTENASVQSVVMFDISNYNRITIEVIKWSTAHRRARIEEIFVGVNKVFSKTDLLSYGCSYSANPISAELPKSEISFSISNIDELYNPYNTQGLSKYLIERQEITVNYGYKLDDKIEWIKGGKFYMSAWDAKQNGLSAEFKARDILEFMSGTYYKGLYNENGTSLYDLAEAVLQDADLPLNSDGSVKWVIDDSMKNIYTIAPLPVDTCANCLQLIANAGGCIICQDREGILRIKRILLSSSDTDGYVINHFNSYSKSELSLSKPLKQVDVPLYSFSKATETSELFKGTMSINGTNDVVITYSGTATDVTATLSEGAVLNKATYYSNACVLNITASGDVMITLNGYSLEQSSVQITTISGVDGETVTVNNPLITSQERAVEVGSWVEKYMRNRMILSSQWRADPRLDALDIIDNENDYIINKTIMTNVKYSYNGAFRGSGEGRVI